MSQGGAESFGAPHGYNALEKERGITISSKYTSFPWRSCTLNAVDTPGHADFGGEVERVLDMVDGCLLLVDATEGPMAQTKFVLSKALQKGLRPIVVMNKVDRDGVTADGCAEVESKLFDLFASMGADDEQLDFATVYASARGRRQSRPRGRAPRVREGGGDMSPLLDVLLERVPSPPGSPEEPFRMLVSMIEHDAFVGRLVTGRVASGRVKVGDRIKALPLGGDGERESGRVTKIFTSHGGVRSPLDSASAGDIVSVAGLTTATVTDTLAAPEARRTSVGESIDPPTLKMTFGERLASRRSRGEATHRSQHLGQAHCGGGDERGARVLQQPGGGGDRFEVQGRGELHLGVLIETMRREKFELSVSPPAVLFKDDPDRPGKKPNPSRRWLRRWRRNTWAGAGGAESAKGRTCGHGPRRG